MTSNHQPNSRSSSQSPRQPPSPTLQPRAHRQEPSSSSTLLSSTASSSSLGLSTTQSTSSPSSSSSSDEDEPPYSSTEAMSNSIISTLDLDESEQETTSDESPQRIPLVREDTATKAVMEGIHVDTDAEESIHLDRTPSVHTHHLPQDAAPHEPKTTTTKPGQPETVPTVSATGMPRFLPRSLDDPTKQGQVGSTGPPPAELQPQDNSSAAPRDVPTGSLTLAALLPSSSMTLRRRIGIISASIFVNLGLPFVNGVMLGFGEIFARSLVAPLVLGGVYAWWPGLRGGAGGIGVTVK